jgi:hypothetical protein
LRAAAWVRVESGTVLQSVDHGDEELRVYTYGAAAETENVEFLDSAV